MRQVLIALDQLANAIYLKHIREKSGAHQQTFYVSVRAGKRYRKRELDAYYWRFVEFGAGEWSVGAWVNMPTDLATAAWPSLGSELNTGAAFSAWTGQGTGVSVDGVTGVLTLTNPSSAAPVYRSLIATVGKTYRATVTIDSISGAGIFFTHSAEVAASPTFTVPGTYTFTFTRTGGDAGLSLKLTATTLNAVVSAISVKEVAGTLTIADRAHSSGPSIKVGILNGGFLTATAYDGTTTRTVTTAARYNTGVWTKAEACYTTDGTLAIRVNGVEVAATRGNPLLTLNNNNAVLTIGNSFNLDAPFPGSLALLKLSATVPTAEQSIWMYEQEKQMFREGAQVCLPDSGSIVDLAYDDSTDTWIAASATNVSEWSGLVRTKVTPTPAGSYSKLAASCGVQLQARTTTNPGVDITIPSYNIKSELEKRSESAAKIKKLTTFDYDSVSGQTEFVLPLGYTTKAVYVNGFAKWQGVTKDYTLLYDGFKETVKFAVAPTAASWIQIHAEKES